MVKSELRTASNRKPKSSSNPKKSSKHSFSDKKHKDKKPKDLETEDLEQEQMIVEEPPKIQYGYTVGHLEPTTEMQSLYTGGKIIYRHPYFYSSCQYKICVWDYQTSQIVARISHEGEEIVNFTINSTTSILSTYTSNNLLRLLDVNNNYAQISVLKLPHYFPIDMEFSYNDKFLALGCVNSHVKILSVPSLRQTHDYKYHSGSVRKIEWHPTELILNSIDENKMFLAFDVSRGKLVHKQEGFGNIFSQTRSGGNIVGVGDYLTVLDRTTWKSQYQVLIEEDPETICIFGEEPYLLYPGKNQELCCIDLNDPAHQITSIQGLYEGILMKIIPLNETIFALITSEQNIYIVSAESTPESFTRRKVILGYNDEILDIKFSKCRQFNPNIFVMATNSSLLKVYNIENKEVQILSGHKEIVLSVSFVYPWLASCGKDNTVKLWKFNSAMNARLVATYKGHSANVTSVILSLVSSEIISVSEDKTIKIWKMFEFEEPKIIKNSQLTIMAHEKSINSLKLNPTEDLIATCSQDKLVKVWSKTLELKFSFKGHKKGVWDISFHPVEKILVSASSDGSLKIWNIVSGECISTVGEGAALLKCQWLFNNQVLTTTSDGILKVWDIRKSTYISFDNHEGRIWAMDISRIASETQYHIVTAGIDSKILIWRDKTSEKLLEVKLTGEKQERIKLTYELAISNKDYIGAAKLAFKEEYHELFIKALEPLHNFVSEQSVTTLQNQQLIFENPNFYTSHQEFEQLIVELIEIDVIKLLKIVQNLNTISRYFKIANKILNLVLGNLTIDEIFELQGKYHEEKAKGGAERDGFNKKESDFEDLLARLVGYNENHGKRLDSYHKKSYWMDYQSVQKM